MGLSNDVVGQKREEPTTYYPKVTLRKIFHCLVTTTTFMKMKNTKDTGFIRFLGNG